MDKILDSAINGVIQSGMAWYRYITANDTGLTGGHQAGFYVPKCAAPILFNKPGHKGENKEKIVKIFWQNNFTTESCIKYYGMGTRNEYRITRFGRFFPFFQDEYIGSLLILIKNDEFEYSAYVLSSDEDIDGFHSYFNLSPGDSNKLIDTSAICPDKKLEKLLLSCAQKQEGFPITKQMALFARECYNNAYSVNEQNAQNEPDGLLLSWIETEYSLFRIIEENVYSSQFNKPFTTVDKFIKLANEVLNRRKSKAGKSLEHHLSEIFTMNKLIFEPQGLTEGRKRPDFLFPNSDCYHNFEFPTENLVVLGAKTTCKDRWRQVLSEADRVEEKFLFTLQQGVSSMQLKEMTDSHLTLVVPKNYISNFPKEYRPLIKDLTGFVDFVKEKQQHMPKLYSL